MALLSRSPSADVRARWLACLALAACAGCVLIDALGGHEHALVFSHALHVGEEGLECVSCHETAAVANEPGLPVLDGCEACHETIDASKPEERRISTLFDADGRFRAANVTALPEEVVFAHLAHVKTVGDCGACHVGIAASEAIDVAVRVDMDACTSCHAERSAPEACATCHTEVGLDRAPPSHAHDWKLRHGQRARLGRPEPADRCALCHEQSSCDSCHRDEPPQDHNNYFRLRGHGLRARLDRDVCAACHDSYTCERCHMEVLPQNHTAMWGNPRDTHCLTCHLPLATSACSTCHKDTPSHLLGTPKPAWHNAAMNCRQCHGVSVSLPHVDNGTNCNACHP